VSVSRAAANPECSEGPDLLDPSPVRKRSVAIDGRVTSLSLEDEFWEELRVIAARRGLTLERLVQEVDADRTHHNRSSALRLYVLRFAKGVSGANPER
jgi:predicted DNA-binding ribbon-helix-helix protein